MKCSTLAAVAAVGILAGCTFSSSDTIRSLPSALQADAYVSDIVIQSVPANASASFKEDLLKALQKHLHQCARGKQPLRLAVSVESLAKANAAATVLVGGSDKIKGSAQLIDPATNSVVGDYDIARSVGGGGIIAAVVLADAEDKMTNGFADEVCLRAFGKSQ